jgi:hypothetical protein
MTRREVTCPIPAKAVPRLKAAQTKSQGLRGPDSRSPGGCSGTDERLFSERRRGGFGDHAMPLKLAGRTAERELDQSESGSAKRLGHPEHRRTTVVITPPFGTR